MLEIVALAAALQQQGTIVTVAAGDTLSSIAGPNWPSVCKANGISNCNLIFVGQRINLGGSGGSSTPVGTSQADHEPDGDSDDPATPAQAAPVQAAPVQQAPAAPSAGASSGSLSDVPGVPQSFAACVAFRESTNGTNPAANGNVYGIIPASGVNVAGDSIAQQKAAFSQLYAADGTAPWAPFDGC